MPVIKCPHSGCVYNSSNVKQQPGICQFEGTLKLTQVYDDYLDCLEFKPKSLEVMKDPEVA